jgi:hypothetical protein
MEILSRLLLNDEVLDQSRIQETRAVLNWASKTLMEGNIFTVENWLEVSYHLCKQRWDSSVDWLETQPMSKIHAMLDVVKRHAEDVEKEQKKAARKKR